jgi:hypothetical protein
LLLEQSLRCGFGELDGQIVAALTEIRYFIGLNKYSQPLSGRPMADFG